ncbi:MAG: cation transporter, partial [Halieaceae bacterium]|nr:cation transporter [Halieaceae bacterium]
MTAAAISARQQTLAVEGAGCASCVSKIEQALAAVPGVERAEMNFADRTVAVSGSAGSEQLIAAIERAGYNARAMADVPDEQALDDKTAADQAYYRRLLVKMAVALGVGVPLMAWGLLGGAMTVTTGGERLAWLAVGLATLGVMAFSGRHFYVGAWRTLANHTANMDTLIALGT